MTMTPVEAVERLKYIIALTKDDAPRIRQCFQTLDVEALTLAITALEAQPNYPEIPDSSPAQPVAGGVDWPEREADVAWLERQRPDTEDAAPDTSFYMACTARERRIDRIIAHLSPTPDVGALVVAVQEACDLLAERTHGSPARSPGHNARVRLETGLSAFRGKAT